MGHLNGSQQAKVKSGVAMNHSIYLGKVEKMGDSGKFNERVEADRKARMSAKYRGVAR